MKNIEFLDAKKITKNTSKGDSKMLRILVHKTQAPLPIKIIVLSQKSLPGRKTLGYNQQSPQTGKRKIHVSSKGPNDKRKE